MRLTYPEREYADVGGLMAYGTNVPDNFRRAADYVDRILKGAKPGDLPIQEPVKFDFVANLKTAKDLGLTIPPAILARAKRLSNKTSEWPPRVEPPRSDARAGRSGIRRREDRERSDCDGIWVPNVRFYPLGSGVAASGIRIAATISS